MSNKSLKNKTVLFLEDNEEFASNTIKLLELYFKEVIHCVSIKSAKKLFDEIKEIDIILSDLKVNDGIALEFIKKVREENKEIPIAVLSAHKDEQFLLEAIPLGLLMYMVKPISFEEFEKFVKEAVNFFAQKTDLYYIDDNIYYDNKRKSVFMDNNEISLTKKEIDFIELLLKNKNKITTKEDIETYVWKKDSMSEAALKKYDIASSKKIGKNIIVTIQSIGYKL